ncbi:MAG: hypothetical protein WBF35_04020 [Candidatus Acidiferrales bacterium]
MSERESISIWFFIGISLLGDGLLTFGAGLWEILHHVAVPVVLSQYHANAWGGAILVIVGAAYCWWYAPGRTR